MTMLWWLMCDEDPAIVCILARRCTWWRQSSPACSGHDESVQREATVLGSSQRWRYGDVMATRTGGTGAGRQRAAHGARGFDRHIKGRRIWRAMKEHDHGERPPSLVYLTKFPAARPVQHGEQEERREVAGAARRRDRWMGGAAAGGRASMARRRAEGRRKREVARPREKHMVSVDWAGD